MSGEVPVKTARRTLELVETIGRLDGASFQEVMTEMGMPKSTAHDYVHSLLELGYLIEDDGEYYLATKFLELGEKRRRRMKIFQSARPEIRKLAEQTGEHASVVIEESGEGVLLDTAIGDEALRLNVYPGQHVPISSNAAGKAILAHMPEERVARIIEEHGMPVVTKNTITDRTTLEEELETIRDRGYAVDLEELVEGVRSVAVPIVVRGTVKGAIAMGGPVQRFTDERMTEEIPTLLLETANVIEVNYIHS